MKKTFEKLKQISSGYRAAVDRLAPDYRGQANNDHLYSDAEKERRVTERNAAFNAEIDKAAQRAAETAAGEIGKLRRISRAYITSSADVAMVQTLQVLLSSGVELSGAEIDAFAEKGGYSVLRLLEKPSMGRVQAPRLEIFERDLRDLEDHFKCIAAYRGELADIGTNGHFGMSPAVGSVIMERRIDGFAAKVNEIAERWACVETE